MNRIAEILRDSTTPLIIVRKVGETASAEATLNAFNDGSDGFAIVSNLSEIHSPTSGNKLAPVEGLAQPISTEDYANLSEMVVEGETAYTLFMDPDLAFDLAGETIKSPVDGAEVTVNYKEADASEENADEEDEDKDAIVPAKDEHGEVASEEDESIEEDLDSGIEEVDGEDEIDAEVDADVDSELEGDDEGTEGDDSEGDEGGEADGGDEEIEEASEEGGEGAADVDAAKTSTLVLEAEHDATQPLRLVQMDAQGSEVAAFSGAAYIGSMHRSKAATNTQSLFDNGQKLYSAFKSVLGSSNGLRSPEVASFGFEPVVQRIEVASVIAQAIEDATKEVKATTEAEVASVKARFQKVLGIAMLGINKGFFEGAGSLVSETASVLTSAGVKNGEAAVRRALTSNSEQFAVAVVEKATELLEQSDDYLRGVSESIVKTEFKTDVTNAAPVVHEAPAETAGFHGSFTPATKTAPNRFSNLVSGIGRRR